MDYLLPRVYEGRSTGHFFSSSASPFPGECGRGADSQIMDFGRWAVEGHIPISKLVVGVRSSFGAVHGCPAHFQPGKEIQLCMPSDKCEVVERRLNGDDLER